LANGHVLVVRRTASRIFSVLPSVILFLQAHTAWSLAFLGPVRVQATICHARSTSSGVAGLRPHPGIRLLTQWLGLVCRKLSADCRFNAGYRQVSHGGNPAHGIVFTLIMFITFQIAFDVIMPKGPLEALLGY